MAIESSRSRRRGTHVVAALAWLAVVGCGSADNPGGRDGGSVDTAQAPAALPVAAAIDSSPPLLNRPIWIEGGTFVMGTDDSYPTRGPAHEVTVSSFWIQEHEVTNAEFRAFDPTHRSVAGPDDHPVAYVQWREAIAYAESLGGSLPTEAQWEYAARGREGRTYPWGEAEPTCALAHYDACGSRGTLPVMSLPGGATPEGVYDLAGNVMEWMSDRYGPYAAGPVSNPTGPSEGDRRVLRGGGWMLDTLYLPATSRTSWPEVDRPAEVDGTPHIGFRVVWPGDAGRDSPPRTN